MSLDRYGLTKDDLRIAESDRMCWWVKTGHCARCQNLLPHRNTNTKVNYNAGESLDDEADRHGATEDAFQRQDKRPPYEIPSITFRAGDNLIATYGARTAKIVLHNSRDFTDEEWKYVEHLRCRLSPYGTISLTGRVGQLAPWAPLSVRAATPRA